MTWVRNIMLVSFNNLEVLFFFLKKTDLKFYEINVKLNIFLHSISLLEP